MCNSAVNRQCVEPSRVLHSVFGQVTVSYDYISLVLYVIGGEVWGKMC